jgi:DNA mismatch repair protein MutS2
MDERSLRVLEFYQFKDLLKEGCISPLGSKRCEALKPSCDLSSIRSRLTEVLELKKVLEIGDDLPLQGLKDIEGVLNRLEIEGSVLGVQELVDIYRQIELCRVLRRFFQRLDPAVAPRLQEKISRLSNLKALEKEILQTISPKGEILDKASPALSEIRHRLMAVRERVQKVLEHLLVEEEWQPVLQEEFITLRNGRYVLPVKASYKNRLEGIVHDQSQTRQTIFFEPLQVVTHNNEINLLVGEEKEEEYRILADLSLSVREEVQTLKADFEILGDLDLLYAMARFSIRLRGVSPYLADEGKIDLREARHPLLALQKEVEVVPIDLRFPDGIKTLIISGANAGGKTVALKTLGLLTLMVQCGLPIPVAEGSHARVFQEIFAVIGDEQNIEKNLSTFSSHLLHLDQIIGKTGPNSLVLLDELGVGTDAQEGSAIAMGFLDRFRERGASIVVTTHFDRLKAYGYLHPDVENVAVEFDEKTLDPRYTLSYGFSGLSNAFLVAEKLGISEGVLERARHYREGGGQEISRVLETLEKLKSETERERLELWKMKEEASSKRQRLKELVEQIKKKRQEIFASAEEEAKRSVHSIEEELKEWIRQQKEEKSRSHLPRFNVKRREIGAIKEKFLPSSKAQGPSASTAALRVGDRVFIEGLRSEGTLLKIEEPEDRIEVLTEKGKVIASLSDVVKVSDEKETQGIHPPKSAWTTRGIPEEPPSSMNVIGLTVEDAIPLVDRFIDQALLHGLEKVQIIHGIGSGRLRDGIGKFLRSHQGVKRYGPGEGIKGGAGITIVELV